MTNYTWKVIKIEADNIEVAGLFTDYQSAKNCADRLNKEYNSDYCYFKAIMLLTNEAI